MDAEEVQTGVWQFGREVLRVEYARHGRPIDWDSVFGRRAPLELEIGTSSGEFLCARAKAQPEADHIGVEIKNDRVRRFGRRIATHGLSNVRCVHGDLAQLAPCLVEAGRLRRVYLLFPDPWPKKRHHKNRLLNRWTLEIIARWLEPGGELLLATDDPDYLAWMRECLAESAAFEGPVTERADSPFGHPTRYETYWIADGRTNTYLSYRRRDAEATRGARTGRRSAPREP